MPSIQLSGVAPADAVDENGNPLNPRDAFGFPLYPAPTAEQLRSPNPIDWPTRAPGQAPVFSNPVGKFVGPPTDPNSPNLWRGGNAVYNAGVNAYNTYGPELADAYRRFGGDVGKAYSWLFGHTGKPAQPDMSNPAMFGGDVGGVSPSDLPAPGLTLNTPPAQAAPAAPTAQPGPSVSMPSDWPSSLARPTAPTTAPTNPPLPPPRPTTAPINPPLPPRRPKNLDGGGGRGGNVSGNRIPPPSVNLGYGAPGVGVGHYVPTTGVGRGPGTYVPGYQGDIVSGTDLGSQIHNLGVNIGRGLNNTFGIATPPSATNPIAAPTEHFANYIPDGKGGIMKAPWASGASQPAVKPLGAFAQGGTVNLPTSYILPGGSRLTPQGDVIPP